MGAQVNFSVGAREGVAIKANWLSRQKMEVLKLKIFLRKVMIRNFAFILIEYHSRFFGEWGRVTNHICVLEIHFEVAE